MLPVEVDGMEQVVEQVHQVEFVVVEEQQQIKEHFNM